MDTLNIFGLKIEKNKLVNFIKLCSKIGLLILIFFSILILNHSVLLSPDDYNYTWVQGSNMTQKVDSLQNCIQTGKFFYNNWTGRVLPHVLIGLFRNMNPYIYEITNTIVFMIFIITINKVLNEKTTFFGILSIFGYLSFSKMFGEKFAWISGTFNYLWPSTILVIFIYYLYNYFLDNKNLNIFAKIAFFMYAFIAGFMHENTAFVGGAFFTILVLFNIKKFFKFEKNKKTYLILLYLVFCCGAFLNIFAPGNFKRVNETDTSFSWHFLDNYIVNILPILLMLISIFIVFIINNFKEIKNEKLKFFKEIKEWNLEIVKNEILYFILPALVATVPMAVISYFPPRAFLAYETMFMIVFSKNICYIIKHFEKYNIQLAILSVVMCLVVFGKFSPSTLGQINYIIPYKNKIESEYDIAKQNGEKDVLVSKFKYGQWIHKEDYINIANFFPEFDYHMPVNALVSMYYGFDRVTAIDENSYLIEIEVDTEGINPYFVVEKETDKNIYTMEYDNFIRYEVPKDKVGEYLLDCRKNNLKDKIIKYTVRGINEEKTSEISLDSLIIVE